MKKIILAIVFICLVATNAMADLKFGWSQYEDTDVDGFHLYMDTGDNSVLTLPITAVTAQVPTPTDGKCHNYWLRAYEGDIESLNSDVATWCPTSDDPAPAVMPAKIGGFRIITTIEPIQ